jgi:hypothetical protein
MKISILAAALFLAGCHNALGPEASSPADSNAYTLAYSAGGPELSRLLGWRWAKEGSDFIWMFKNDGTVSVIHCCGEVYHKQFSYLLCGNILVTYGHETSFDEIEATVFTMAGDGASFTRSNGTSFTRREPDAGPLAASPLALSNDLPGIWQDGKGTYEFRSDAELRINSPSGSGQYRYLVRYAELLILGPLVDGTPAALRKYWFNRTGSKLYLRGPDGKKYILTSPE